MHLTELFQKCEGILDQIIRDTEVNTDEVHRVILERSERFKKHLEGESLKGFIDRSQGIASDILRIRKPKTKTNKSRNKTKKNI